MKFAITGHTSGIGKAVAELCHMNGYPWIGFSRGTGYDIAEDYDKIVNESSDCDVFINNAYYDYVQIDLLYKMWDIWKDQRKQIVCISSLVGDRRHSGDAYPYCPYIVHKAALDNACEILCNTVSECAVINIKPGAVDTPIHEGHNTINKLDPQHLADNILWCIEQPVHIQTMRISAQ